ncbi:unnamed protein product, partial [Didymodactylos carnosus]
AENSQQEILTTDIQRAESSHVSERTEIYFYDENDQPIILLPEVVPHTQLQNCKQSELDKEQARDQGRYERQPYDVIIMQLGDTGVGKSSLCQALTNNLGFRHGNLNGTTLRPRAGFIVKPTNPSEEQLRYVIIDVPGLNQAVIDETRNLYFVRMKEDIGKCETRLEVGHIAQLIVDLTKMMTICLLVIDDKIKEAFKDLYKKVIDIIIKGIKELVDNKNKTDEELKSIAEQRLIIVVNKFDRLCEFADVCAEKENIKRNIRQVLVNDNIPIVFTAGASYAASKNAGNFNPTKMAELNSS